MKSEIDYLELRINRKKYFQLVINGVCVSSKPYRTRLQCLESYVIEITDQKGILDFPVVNPF